MIVCKICGKEVPSQRGMLNHIRVHKISSDEYRTQYEDFITGPKDPELIVCPICGKYNFKNLLSHINWKHPKYKDTFKQMYPNMKMYSESYKEQCAKAGSKALKVQRQNPEKWKSSRKKGWKTRNERHPELLGELHKASHKALSKRLTEQWKDPEYRAKKSEQAKEQHRSGNLTDQIIKHPGKVIPYKQWKMRSSWEVRLAEILDTNQIEYIYEPFYVPYVDGIGKHRKYYPDFYIKSLNMILEVKPLYQLDYDEVKLKRLACLDLGYKYHFITEVELFKDRTIINKVIDDYKSNK